MKKVCIILTLLALLQACFSDTYDINNEAIQKEAFKNDFNKSFGVTSSDYANHQWGLVGSPDSISMLRIFCEDLGTLKADFDYNDLVFDIEVRKVEGLYEADITILAVGSPLPITIDGKEVHGLFSSENPNGDIMTETFVNSFAGRHEVYSPVHMTVVLDGYHTWADVIR